MRRGRGALEHLDDEREHVERDTKEEHRTPAVSLPLERGERDDARAYRSADVK